MKDWIKPGALAYITTCASKKISDGKKTVVAPVLWFPMRVKVSSVGPSTVCFEGGQVAAPQDVFRTLSACMAACDKKNLHLPSLSIEEDKPTGGYCSMDELKYPDTFRSFEQSSDTDDAINRRIRECIKRLDKSGNGFASSQSNGSLVMVFQDDPDIFDIIVATGCKDCCAIRE